MRSVMPTLLQESTGNAFGAPVTMRIFENARQYRGQVCLALVYLLTFSIANAGMAGAGDVQLTQRQVYDMVQSYLRPGPKSRPDESSNPTGNDLQIVASSLGWSGGVAGLGPNGSLLDASLVGGTTTNFTVLWIDPLGAPVKTAGGQTDTGLAVGDLMDTVQITTRSAAQLAAIDADLTFTGTLAVRAGAYLAHPDDDVHVGMPLIIRRVAGITDAARQMANGQHWTSYLDFDTAQAVTVVLQDISLAGARRSTGARNDELLRLNAQATTMDLGGDRLPTFLAGATTRFCPLVTPHIGDNVAGRPTGPLNYTLAVATPHAYVDAYTPGGAEGAPVVSQVAQRGTEIAQAEARPRPVQYEPHILSPGSGRSNITHKVGWRGITRQGQTARSVNEATLVTNVAAGMESGQS